MPGERLVSYSWRLLRRAGGPRSRVHLNGHANRAMSPARIGVVLLCRRQLMTSITRRLFLSLAAALAPGAAIAHHGWGGYDTSKSFTVTGKILKSTYENPHCEIEMEVDGKHWRFVLAPPSRMERRGITPDLIAPGKTCTLFGYPHTSNPEEARIEYIILDGKRIELR